MHFPYEAIAMTHAITLAQDYAAPLGPNPRVGAVILNQDGEYLSEGFHLGKSTDHAEISALKKMHGPGDATTLVVTLEPCYQPNRPDDCSRAIVRAGIKRVIIGQRDTTPMSAGGAEFLRANNIDVVTGVCADEVSGINPWLTIAMAKQRPYVRAKIAASLDGKVAAADGSSRWITGKESRQYAHRLRSQSHYLVSTAKSVLQDNSRLSARDEIDNRMPIQPKIAILGRETVPANHPLMNEGLEISFYPKVDLAELLNEFWKNQGLSVLIESGPTLITEFLKQGLVDELIWFTAPILLGDNSRSSIGNLGIDSISAALRPHFKSTFKLGPDQVSVLTFWPED